MEFRGNTAAFYYSLDRKYQKKERECMGIKTSDHLTTTWLLSLTEGTQLSGTECSKIRSVPLNVFIHISTAVINVVFADEKCKVSAPDQISLCFMARLQDSERMPTSRSPSSTSCLTVKLRPGRCALDRQQINNTCCSERH